VSAPVDQGRSYQICSDIPSCVCIQPLVDFLRGSKGCSLGFPKQYQPLLGYTHIQSLFSSLPFFGPSFDWDRSWVSTPLSFQLTIRLSLTAPTFNKQIVRYRQNICTYRRKIFVPTEAKILHPQLNVVSLCPQRQRFCTHRGKIIAPTLVFKAGTIISACKPFQIMKIKNDSNFAPIPLLHRLVFQAGTIISACKPILQIMKFKYKISGRHMDEHWYIWVLGRAV